LKNDTTYNVIKYAIEAVLFKIKGSKFLSFAYPILSEQEAKEIIERLKKQYYQAHHCCYAYQIGIDKNYFRIHDDGEPKNTAGAPIYGQIQSFNLSHILVVVIRYFGGTKLGVGGLLNAYKTAAQMALEQAVIIEKTINIHYIIHFDYKNINQVMRIIKEKNIYIVLQNLEKNPCTVEIAVPKNNNNTIFNLFNTLHEINIGLKEN